MTSPHQVVPDADSFERHVPGEVGVWILIFFDMTVFALLFGTYVFYRAQQPEIFYLSSATLDQRLGGFNTLVLLTSSLCVATAVQATRSGSRRCASLAFKAAIVCGGVFVSVKCLEWGLKISHGMTPATNNFFMLYYVTTGLHLVHVVVGIAVLIFLFRMIRGGAPSVLQRKYLEGGGCFWHMVDLLWLVIFSLYYLAAG